MTAMFELLLNAATLALSKDARETANSLVDALTRSPEWKKEICTIEARIPYKERERAQLLEDLISDKLKTLSYGTKPSRAFRTVYGELTGNAFEHGTKGLKDERVRLVIDISPTYVATSVYNPRGTRVDIDKWIAQAADHLKSTEKMRRGRGLLVAYRKADVLEPIGTEGVKAVVYRDSVEIITDQHKSFKIVVATAGHSNPSFGKRIVEHLEKLNEKGIVLCLDPNAYHRFKNGNVGDAEMNDTEDSVVFEPIFRFISSTRDKTKVRLVISDDDVRDLLPRDHVASSIDAALKSLE
jgi:anti-sigma regulatory factor (Ser/Thr protein kinase)